MTSQIDTAQREVVHLEDAQVRPGRSSDDLIPRAVAVNTATLARLTVTEGTTLRRLLAKLIAEV